ncbi:DNA-3-methyladenine glycosylase II [candidate division TM7 genomosp. GTL1]|nr:DNA-3-methyladenine glycosylase II [candidate division TM7 genomosp. GTL1]
MAAKYFSVKLLKVKKASVVSFDISALYNRIMTNSALATQIAAAEVTLAIQDTKLGALIAAQAPLNRLRKGDYFANLVRSIISQQVSVAASRAILARVQAATGLEPKRILALNPEELRALGLSRPKAGYISDLAEHFVREPGIFDHLERLADDEVITELTRIKGIGAWTAQMFLMFTLGRLDIFAPDDVGLQRAITRLYGLKEVPSRTQLEALAEAWRPYRTVASWHLWESLTHEPYHTT